MIEGDPSPSVNQQAEDGPLDGVRDDVAMLHVVQRQLRRPAAPAPKATLYQVARCVAAVLLFFAHLGAAAFCIARLVDDRGSAQLAMLTWLILVAWAYAPITKARVPGWGDTESRDRDDMKDPQ